MSWKMITTFLISLIVGVVLAVVVLGAIGFVLGGSVGLVNMASWGVALGLVGGMISGAGVLMADYEENIGRGFRKWIDEEEGKKRTH